MNIAAKVSESSAGNLLCVRQNESYWICLGYITHWKTTTVKN